MRPSVNISSAAIYPDAAGRKVTVSTKLINRSNKATEAKMEMAVGSDKISHNVILQPGENTVKLAIKLSKAPKLWDEFSQDMYKLRLTLTDLNKGTKDTRTERFGFRDLKVSDGKLIINGRQLFLRGTLDCAAFPRQADR